MTADDGGDDDCWSSLDGADGGASTFGMDCVDGDVDGEEKELGCAASNWKRRMLGLKPGSR